MEILRYPNRILTTPTQAFDVDRPLIDLTLIKSMEATLRECAGIGLAANQVGIGLSVALILRSSGKIQTLINPEITWRSVEKEFGEEACLSLPGVFCNILRHLAVRVRYTNVDLKEAIEDFQELEARVVQHELDHLSGKLIFMHLPQVMRGQLLAKIRKTMRLERANTKLVQKFGGRSFVTAPGQRV